jgi:Skp family chaperone for outer membrane proteins
MRFSMFARAVAIAALAAGAWPSPFALAQQAPAQGQGGQQWFVPGQGGAPGAGQPRPPAQPAQAQPAPRPAAPPAAAPPAAPMPPPQVSIQQLPPLAPSPPPPAAVIGILDVDLIRARWQPYANLDNAIRSRVNRLRADEQRERQSLDEATRAFVAQRAQLSADQQRARQRQIEERAAELTRQFGDRQREVQALAQNAEVLDQILRAVLNQVAQARGINLILRSQMVGLNHSSLDITTDVLNQLQLVPVQMQIPPEVPPAPPAAAAPAPAAPAAPAAPRPRN